MKRLLEYQRITFGCCDWQITVQHSMLCVSWTRSYQTKAVYGYPSGPWRGNLWWDDRGRKVRSNRLIRDLDEILHHVVSGKK